MRMNFSNTQKSVTTVGLTAVGLTVVLIAFVFAVFTPQQVLLAQPAPGFDLGGFVTETDDAVDADEVVRKAAAEAAAREEAAKKAAAAEEAKKAAEEKAKQLEEAAKKAATKITTISLLFARATDVLNVIVPFIIGLAILVIIWGILGYISHAGEEEKRQEAKQFVVWSIIALFIMLSIWGFVNVLVGSFDLNNDIPAGALTPSLPCIPNPPTVTCE